MNLRILSPLLGLCSAVALASAATVPAKRPNIVVIIADDLGYGDVGVHGTLEIPTPNIDSIARDGVRFANGYVSGPYCSPTRAGLLSGRYQNRFGHEFNPPGPSPTNQLGSGLPLTETTLPQRLKSTGYVTGLVGKWHLGGSEPYNPINRGFSEFFGFLGAAHSYTNLDSTSPNPIRRGLQPVSETNYLTDAFTREAVSFIERHRQEPFYLQLAYNAVHSPLDFHPRHYERFAHIEDPKRRRFASLYGALDEGVGKVLATLRESGLDENTLVFFISDNGGPTNDNTSRNGPLRGYKAQTWEGGIHVPFFARWKGKLPAGTVYSNPVIQLDIHATALAVAGIDIQPGWKLDGVNLLPYVSKEKTGAPHDALFWRFGPQIAVRQGDWKLVKGQDGLSNMGSIPTTPASADGAELYNLAADPGETRNLATENPAKLRELTELWTRWNSELPPPAWKPGNRPPGGRGPGQNATNAAPESARPI